MGQIQKVEKMKDNPFLVTVLSKQSLQDLERIASAEDHSFDQLVHLGNLDPNFDLRNADLTGVDMSNANLCGFDFTGANLSNSVGINVTWDSTTKFDGATLAGSVFAFQKQLDDTINKYPETQDLIDNISKADWAKQALWAGKNLLRGSRYNHIATKVTTALFLRTEDKFLISQLLQFLVPKLNEKMAIKEMLTAAICDHPNNLALIKSAFKLFRQYQLHKDHAVRQIIMTLVIENHVQVCEESIRFILSTAPSKKEVKKILALAIAGNSNVGRVYVSEVAKLRGEEYELITRDPISSASFDISTALPYETLELIARKWLRVGNSSYRGDKERPLYLRKGFGHDYSADELKERKNLILEMWEHLRSDAIDIRVNGN